MKNIISKNWDKIKSDLEVFAGIWLFAWVLSLIINTVDKDEAHFPMVTLMTFIMVVFVQAMFSMIMFSYEFNLKASFGMTRWEYFIQFVGFDLLMMVLYSLVLKLNLLLENWLYIDVLKYAIEEDEYIIETIVNYSWLILILLSAIKLLCGTVYIRLGQKFLVAFSIIVVILCNAPALLKKFGVLDKDIIGEIFNSITINVGVIVITGLVSGVFLLILSWITFRKQRVML